MKFNSFALSGKLAQQNIARSGLCKRLLQSSEIFDFLGRAVDSFRDNIALDFIDDRRNSDAQQEKFVADEVGDSNIFYSGVARKAIFIDMYFFNVGFTKTNAVKIILSWLKSIRNSIFLSSEEASFSDSESQKGFGKITSKSESTPPTFIAEKMPAGFFLSPRLLPLPYVALARG